MVSVFFSIKMFFLFVKKRGKSVCVEIRIQKIFLLIFFSIHLWPEKRNFFRAEQQFDSIGYVKPFPFKERKAFFDFKFSQRNVRPFCFES